MQLDALKKLIIILLLFLEILPHFSFGQTLLSGLSKDRKLKYAESLIENNNVDSALVYLNSILYVNPMYTQALIVRSKVWYNSGAFEKAVIDYTALLERNPEDKETLYLRGLARQNLSLYQLALEDYHRALKLTNEETNVAFFRIDPETNAAEGISTINNMSADIYNKIGLCYHYLEEYDLAIKYFNLAIAEDKLALDVFVNRAVTYTAVNEIQLAKNDYIRVLEKEPNHTVASFNLLQLNRLQGNYDEALNSLIKFTVDYPGSGSGYEALGLFYFETNEYNLALENFRKAAAIDTLNLDYKFNLALALDKNEKYAEAKMLFEEVIEKDPLHSSAYFNLANIYFKSGEFDEAISYYSIAHYHNAENYLILHNRALAYYKTNQLEAACTDMEEVLKSNESLARDFYNNYCEMLSK